MKKKKGVAMGTTISTVSPHYLGPAVLIGATPLNYTLGRPRSLIYLFTSNAIR